MKNYMRLLALATMIVFSSGISASAEYAKANNELDNPGIEIGETQTVEEVPDVLFTGEITDEEPEQVFYFTAPEEGRYSITMEDLRANCNVWLNVEDSYGNNIMDDILDGYRVLEKDETYTIKVSQFIGITGFTVRIKNQKPVFAIDEKTSCINDSFSFKGQSNKYSYTPPLSGVYLIRCNKKYYSMELSDMYGVNSEVYLWSGAYYLEAGTEYTFDIYEDNTMGKYEMEIMPPKKPVDVTGYTLINDTMEYMFQRNEYYFTVPEDGSYKFIYSTKNVNASTLMCVYIYNTKTGETLVDGTRNDGSDELVLDKGTELLISMHQGNYFDGKNKNIGRYQLIIDYPEAAQTFLETFTPSDEAENSTESGETDIEYDSAEVEALKEENQRLTEELENLQQKYDLLTQILKDSGLDIGE